LENLIHILNSPLIAVQMSVIFQKLPLFTGMAIAEDISE
jgi:hypothetical protein